MLRDKKSTNILQFVHVPLSELGTVYKRRKKKKRDITPNFFQSFPIHGYETMWLNFSGHRFSDKMVLYSTVLSVMLVPKPDYYSGLSDRISCNQ